MNASKRKTWNVEEKDSFYEFSGVVHLFSISLWHLQPKSSWYCLWHCVVLMLKTKLEDEGKKAFHLALTLFHELLKLTERENTLEESWTRKQRKPNGPAWATLRHEWPSRLDFLQYRMRSFVKTKVHLPCCGAHGNILTKPIYVIYFTGLNISLKLPVLKLVQFRLIFQISETQRAYNFLKLSWRKLYVLGNHLK